MISGHVAAILTSHWSKCYCVSGASVAKVMQEIGIILVFQWFLADLSEQVIFA